jgi:hypothetical protein
VIEGYGVKLAGHQPETCANLTMAIDMWKRYRRLYPNHAIRIWRIYDITEEVEEILHGTRD